MPREKKTRNCEHCGKEFTQARKEQRYCCAQHRVDHFFDKRDNERAQLKNENETLKMRVKELEAQLAASKSKREPKQKALAS
jgi:cell division septum initiation protein DivIVA